MLANPTLIISIIDEVLKFIERQMFMQKTSLHADKTKKEA